MLLETAWSLQSVYTPGSARQQKRRAEESKQRIQEATRDPPVFREEGLIEGVVGGAEGLRAFWGLVVFTVQKLKSPCLCDSLDL